ncbi:ROK family protein [Alteribacillus bidgolensis]|uniref:Glucokinase n=1 Tax=Alteribacillus bidgolensis TaxID=930129 RepID=A0A1G8H1N5_9BACI|nr:ROK family protein [Alteribacillus bidgolensis]SDI00582.1 glucokinase [Alteribacillus bidgolensis]
MKRREFNGKTLRIGIDLGGTKILGALVDDDGHAVATRQLPTFAKKEHPEKEILQTISTIVQDLIIRAEKEDRTPIEIGIASAGIIDPRTRTIRYAQSLSVKDFSIGEHVEKALQMPVRLCNDTDAAAMAEWQKKSRKRDRFMYVSVGTGIGAGIVMEEKIMQGAGELGHMTVNPKGQICSCGNYGCLKHYASGPAMEEKVRTKGGKYKKMAMPEIVELAEKGDVWCQNVLKEGARYLGLALVNSIHLLALKEIVIGGGVLQKGDYFFSQVEAYVKRFTMSYMAEGITMKPARFEAELGAVGAACSIR